MRKATGVKTVTYGMMNLQTQRKLKLLPLRCYPAQRKNGQKKAAIIVNIELERRKICPRQRRKRKGRRRRIWFTQKARAIPKSLQICQVSSVKFRKVSGIRRPKRRKGFAFGVKNRIAGVHFIKKANLIIFVKRRAKLFVLVGHPREQI